LEFAEWTIPVPQGTPVHEYAPVSLQQRAGERIDVVEDLVLGEDRDPQQAFYRPRTVVPDAGGNIYVLDQGNNRIQVFDGAGRYLRTLGREGEGPGEMSLPIALAVAADRVVLRADRNRLDIWSVDGPHVDDVMLDEDLQVLLGMDDGFVGRRSEWIGEIVMEAPPARRFTFARYDPDGQEESVYLQIDNPPPPVIGWVGARSEFFAGALLARGGMLPAFSLQQAASRDGTLFVTTSEEYQVHAFGPRRWALRVAWLRDPVTREAIDAEMATVPEALATATPQELGFPERFKAIAGLQVDGHGHLYVFPYFPPMDAPRPRGVERAHEPRPVDVYSADGEHVFSGLIDLAAWSGALGDFVYTLRTNPDTEESEVVRYRLVEPFS
jgi:hypothetical protein